MEVANRVKSNWKEYRKYQAWLNARTEPGDFHIEILRLWFRSRDITLAFKELVALAFCCAKWHPKGSGGSSQTCALCLLRDAQYQDCFACVLSITTGCTFSKNNPSRRSVSNICRKICDVFDNENLVERKVKKATQAEAYKVLSDLYRVKYNAYFGTNY